MSHTRYDQEYPEAPAVEQEPTWVTVESPGAPDGSAAAPERSVAEEGHDLGFRPYVLRQAPASRQTPDDRYLRRLSQEVECLRAAFATAGLFQRWRVKRQLLALEKEKARLEQTTWRR